MVCITCKYTYGSTVTFKINSSLFTIMSTTSDADSTNTFTIIIPNANTYSCNASQIVSWRELR